MTMSGDGIGIGHDKRVADGDVHSYLRSGRHDGRADSATIAIMLVIHGSLFLTCVTQKLE